MANISDYETLLRSMSALSHQFAQRRSRTAATPPTSLLNSSRSRSRVVKPKSTTASPSCTAALRRRAATAQQTPANLQFSTAFVQAMQVQPTFNEPPQAFLGPSSDSGRPRSWHADMHPSSSWSTAPHHDTYAEPDTYLQGQADCQGYQFTSSNNYSTYSTMLNTAWAPIDPSLDASSLSGLTPSVHDMPASDLTTPTTFHAGSQVVHPDFLPDPSSTLMSGQRQSFSSEANNVTSEVGTESEGVGELVGMGLYDGATNEDQQPSLLLGAGFHDDEPVTSSGKGLQLEETWSPSVEQVPDAEVDDEGSDTPIIDDLQTWNSMPESAPAFAPDRFPAETPYIYNPQYNDALTRFSGNVGVNAFYDDDGTMMSGEMLSAQQKASTTMSWYDNQWLYYPQQSFYNYGT